MHSYWVTACDGSAKVVFLPDTYVTLTEPVVVDVAPGVSATVFEAGNRVWFTTEDRSAAAWTTKLVPVDRDSLAVGTPIDLGAQVGVVPTTSGVWLTLGTDLYQLRLDSLPRG